MQLLRGWQGLGLFWLGALFATSTGAAVLQFLGPPSEVAPSLAVLFDSADRTGDLVEPVALRTVLASNDIAVEATPATQDVAVILAASPSSDEEAAAGDNDRSATPEPEQPATALVVSAVQEVAFPPLAARKQLRIVRDSRFCTRVECSNWSLVSTGLKRAQPAIVDMSKLRLASPLRQAAEKGEIELIIDASERRETLNGRPIVVYVATSLAGVTPHLEKSRPELLPLPVPVSE